MEFDKKERRNDIVLTVHRALVEAYALKEAGLPLIMDYHSMDPAEDYAKSLAEGAKFEQDANGQVVLVFESEGLRQSVLKCVQPWVHELNRISGDPLALSATTTYPVPLSQYTQATPQQRCDDAIDETEIEEKQEGENDQDQNEEEEEGEVESAGAEEGPYDNTKLDLEGAEQLYLDEEPLYPARASAPVSDTWRSISLEDSAIKFAVSGP